MRFAAIDFETVNRGADSACAVGVVMAEDGRIVHRETHPICPPPGEFAFTYIHGLGGDDVCDAPDFGQVWSRLGPLLEEVGFLAAHNAPFDRRVLHACCDSHGLCLPEAPFECTVALARRVWGIYPTKLPDVCRHLGISLNHHDAASDADACARRAGCRTSQLAAVGLGIERRDHCLDTDSKNPGRLLVYFRF